MFVSRICRLEGFDPWEHLAQEEALFESLPSDSSTLVLYVNQPCVVLGKHQNPMREVHLDVLAERNLPLLRRSSGGGTVYHDEGNLNWSFLVPKEQYEREVVLRSVAESLVSLGFHLQVGPKGDLLWNGVKVSGTASFVRRDSVLHHGTLLCQTRLKDLHGVLGPTGTLRSWVGVASRPTPVKNLECSPEQAVEALKKAFPDADEITPPAPFLQRLSELRSPEWLWDLTPPFEWEGETRLGPLHAKVSAGRIDAVLDDRSSKLSKMVGMPFFSPQLFPGMVPREVL